MPRYKRAEAASVPIGRTGMATRDEVAAYLHVEVDTVDKLLSDPKVPLKRHKVGRAVRIKWSEVEALYA